MPSGNAASSSRRSASAAWRPRLRPAPRAGGLAPARRADSQARRRENHARLSRPPQPCAVRPRGVSGAGARDRRRAAGPARHRRPAGRRGDALHGAGDPDWPGRGRGRKDPPRRRQAAAALARIAADPASRASHSAARRSSSGHRRCCRHPASASCLRPAPSCRRSPQAEDALVSARPRTDRHAPSAPPTCSAASARSPWRWRAAAASRPSTATRARSQPCRRPCATQAA